MFSGIAFSRSGRNFENVKRFPGKVVEDYFTIVRVGLPPGVNALTIVSDRLRGDRFNVEKA